MNADCRVVRRGRQLELHAPAFVFCLDTTHGLRAVAWENRRSGQTLRLGGGHEFDCRLDTAARRLTIAGWRLTDDPRGEQRGYQRPEFDDAKWKCAPNPALFWVEQGPRAAWARTHLFVPADCAGKDLTLVLGGMGLWDFRFMRVFLNGRLIGTRQVRDRWHEPGQFAVTGRVRIGQDNVIALELRDQVRRTPRLDQLDPQRARGLAWLNVWPAQFEQFLVAGRPLTETAWSVARWRMERAGEVIFHLTERRRALTARVRYRWAAGAPTLHKVVEITNASSQPVRLLDLDLGHYETAARVTAGEQGFPVYAADSFFFGVAHPSGWAMGQSGTVILRQHPGRTLAPGETFQSMETVLGVAAKGEARAAFVAHVRSRMRRVRRGHDQPYAIYEPYGGWRIPAGEFLGDAESETILRDHLRRLAVARRRAGLRFDILSVDFWVDNDGDLERPDPKHFPRGFAPVLRELQRLGTAPGLWIDSSMGGWTIGKNPVVSPCYTHQSAYPSSSHGGAGYLCRATEPVRTIYRTAFTHHLRANGVRLVKFDNLHAICYQPAHDHLPGRYSTEAIHNSVIEFLQALDRACPAVLLMLYWGHRSPWWLPHADTLFEPGLAIEAASPAPRPTLHARDGVTQGLDMAQWYCDDLPALGKDSLGVWLSDWPWNSQVGKERWPEGFIMDLGRGSLLAQPWNGERPLTIAEQRQMAEFIALLRAQPKCFANPRFILGNPWKNEPYGYSCSDGQRSFLALNNCTWHDQLLPIEARGQDVYRWYPSPAQLTGATTKIALRPFAVALLEIVPAGQHPTLGREFRRAPMPVSFHEPSCRLDLRVTKGLAVRGRVPASSRGGTLVLAAERAKGGVAFQTNAPGKELNVQARVNGRTVRAVPVLGTQTYPSAWQAWRIRLGASPRPTALRAQITATVPAGVRIRCSGYFIPR